MNEIKINKPGKPNEWNGWELMYLDDDIVSLNSNDDEDLSIYGQGDGDEIVFSIDNDELSKLKFLQKLEKIV